jgi:hypothetical protein
MRVPSALGVSAEINALPDPEPDLTGAPQLIWGLALVAMAIVSAPGVASLPDKASKAE